MVTKRSIFGKMEILEDGQIQLREDTILEENGAELARTYRRRVLEPSDTHSETDTRLTAVIEAVWTPEVIDDFRRKREEQVERNLP